MAIKIINASNLTGFLKASIQKNGRLSVSGRTVEALHISEFPYAKFGRDDEHDKSLYLILTKGPDANTFRFAKAGPTLYLNTVKLFSAMKEEFDFENQSVRFNLVRNEKLDQALGGQVYKMIRRS